MDRNKIEEQYKWDLTKIYKDIEEFNKDYEAVLKQIEAFKKNENIMATSAINFYNTLKE